MWSAEMKHTTWHILFLLVYYNNIQFSSWDLMTHSYLKIHENIVMMVKVFAKSPGDLCSIPGQVIPKTQKMILDTSLLDPQHYKVVVKWSNPGKWVAPAPTPWCRTCRKGSLRVILVYGRQLFSYTVSGL